MSFGRKSQPDVDYPEPITRTTFTNPLGDRFTATNSNGKQTYSSKLSPGTQSLVNTSMTGMQTLAQELNAPDASRIRQIYDRAQDYYDLQASGINQDADDALARTKSDLSKRFGGTYNATFGTSLLADLEDRRIAQLMDVRKEAALMGEDLYQQDEDSRIQRFNLFQNYLNDLNNQARGFQTNSSNVFISDRQLQANTALQRQELANDYAVQNAEIARRNREQAARIALAVAG